jgi:hypothetical protein
VISPTNLLTQTITVYIGNGDRVTIVSEAGTFEVTGSFDAYTNPALVEVELLPNQLNHLEVFAHVRRAQQGNGCVYGDYTLSTRVEVVQSTGLIYLPFVVKPR